MNRGAPLQRRTGLKRHAPLRQKGTSEVSKVKESIQALLREYVIKRDGGCILRKIAPGDGDAIAIKFDFPIPPCNGCAKDGHLILQADHLITRASSASYADPRLVVCVCKGHHGWKSVGSNRRKAQYDAIVRQLIEPERVALWDAMEADHRPHRMTLYDWKKEEAYLKSKVAVL